MKKLAIIIPCHAETNEEILEGIHRLKVAQRWIPYKISIVVSQNGTRSKNYRLPQGVIYYHTQIKGLGAGLQLAFNKITTDYFYFSSCDLPYNFSDLKQMVAQNENVDIIVGSKLHTESNYHINWKRTLGTYVMHLMTILLFPWFPIKDANGTMFGSTEKIKPLLSQMQARDYFFSTEFLIRARKHGLRVTEVPVVYTAEQASEVTTVRFVRDGMKYLRQLLLLRFNI